MNPPDVYDADGHPYDRREEPRREDDEANIIRGYARWAQLMFFHRGKVMVLVAALTWLGTTLGFSYVGPTQEIARVEKKVDTLARRVGNVEATVAEGNADREQIKSRLEFVVYMNCTMMRRTDPNAVPSLCNETRRP